MKNISKNKLVVILAVALAGLSSVAGVRTLNVTENKTNGFVTSASVSFGEASGTSNTLFLAYGVTMGGDTVGLWERVVKAADIPVEADSVEVAMPAGWGKTYRTCRFFLADGVHADGGFVFDGEVVAASVVTELGTVSEFSSFAKRLIVTPDLISVPNGVSYSDVPALIRFSEKIPDFHYADVRRGGYDLKVIDETGSVVPFEVETWNPAGESLVWVKLPTLSVDSRLMVFYGAEGVNAENDPRQVWSAYAGVWHFDEQQDGGSCSDSSPSGYATQNQASNIGDAEGFLGGARNATSGGMIVPNTTKMDLGSSFTVMGFVTRTSTASNWDHLFYKKNSSGVWGGWCTEMYGEGGQYGRISVIARDGRKNTENITHGISAVDTWYHLLIAYEPNKATLYNNGVAKGTGTYVYAPTWTGDNIRNLAFGCASDGTGAGWKGSFDEFRIISGAMSAERAAIEYKSMATNALHFTVATNADTRPVLSKPIVTRNENGTFSVSAGLTAGAATSIKAICGGGFEQELAPSGAAAGWTATQVLSGLPSDTLCILKVKAVNDDGYVEFATADGVFYNGMVSVVRTADAREEDLSSGGFTFSRADTAAAESAPLPISYVIGGTAVAGTDYVALSGEVTIPAGEASVSVHVVPLKSMWTAKNVEVAVTVGPGAYLSSETAASVRIVNFGFPEYTGFRKRTTIEFPGYDRDETLSNVPILIRLGASLRLDPERANFAFFDDAGVKLPYEIDTWNPAQTSLVWVCLTELKKGTAIHLLHAGDDAVTNDPTQVWNDYVGVWHMNETGVGAGVEIFDSAAHHLNGSTPTNAEKIDAGGNCGVSDGRIGGGRKLATGGGAAEKGRILVTNDTAKTLNTDRKVTASLWFRFDGAENWGYLIDRKARDDWDSWGLQLGGADQATQLRLYHENSGYNGRNLGAALEKGRWHHVVAIWNEGSQSLYVDGEQKYSGGGNWIQYQVYRDLAIGGLVYTNGTSAGWGVFPGDVDEVRVTGAVRSEAWALTEYATVANPDFAALSDTVMFGPQAGFTLMVR